MPGQDLVTESCVRQMAPGTVLRLGAGRIATPSALDLAFARGIRVVYGEAGEPARSGAASDLWSRMKATDGSYVVVVRGGRAVVTRLEQAGPMAFGAE